MYARGQPLEVFSPCKNLRYQIQVCMEPEREKGLMKENSTGERKMKVGTDRRIRQVENRRRYSK